MMKVLKVCAMATLLWAPGFVLMGNAAPQTQAQKNHERAQLRAAQREADNQSDEAKARRRTAENRADQRETARRNQGDNTTGGHIVRNAEEAKDTLHDTGRDVRDFFGF